MKTLLLAPVLILSARASLAQPTLTASTTNPVAGESFSQSACGVSSFTMGGSGAAVTWDLSGLTPISTDTLVYLGCAASGLCDSFAGASLASLGGSNMQFYSTDASSFALTGVNIPGGNVYYSTPRKKIIYPATYNITALEPYAFSRPGFDSYGYGTDSITVDAYGTLILPTGTFTNVLRVHTISISIDSNIVSGTTYVDTFRTDVYSWYTPGTHSPLLSMFYDFGGLTGTPELAQIFYYKLLPPGTGVASTPAQDNDLVLYPNPATTELHCRLALASDDIISIEIMDVLGQVVNPTTLQKASTGINTITSDLTGFRAGLYFLQIGTPGGILRKPFIVEP